MGQVAVPGYWYTGARWKQANSASQTSSYSVEASNSSTTSVTLMHTATDDGEGEIAGGLGSVLYSAKSLNLKVVADFQATSFKSSYENASSFETSSNVTDTWGSASPGSTSSGGSSNTKGGEYGTQEFKENFGANSLVVRYKTGVGVPQSASQTYTPPAVTLDLVPYTTEAVVPGSVRFTWMGTVYEDYEGVIYRGRTSSNAGVASGTIDYESGVATMSDYVVSGNPASFTLDSLWTRKGKADPIATIAFNTDLSPIKPGGLVLSVVDVAGNQLIATADINGKILAEHVYGSIDYATGLVEIQFGDFVTAANLTDAEKTEWWYSADEVFTTGTLTGKIWRPWPVLPETLRYNAVAYTYLPLDADILGLDPVRLPSDGRVPIFRPGGFAVVGHTGELTATVSNGQTLNCGRVRLSRVRVVGADGNVIHTGYSVDLEAGLVTFNSVSGYSQPVTVQHRIEDMVLVTNTTSFEVIGEHVGVIAVGNTSTDCAPLNPATGAPYFVIPAAGWGSGWSTGNVLRFNSVGAMFPVWMVRTVQQGPETVLDDRFTVLIRGDVNANP